MIHFNRKTEYALLAIEHMMAKENEGTSVVTNTREMSDSYHIPYPLLAKVMQRLSGKGFVKSVHGTKGGYTLARKPSEITMADIVEAFEGRISVADCLKEEKNTCPQQDGCRLRDPFAELNRKIYNLLTQTTMADLVLPKGQVPQGISTL